MQPNQAILDKFRVLVRLVKSGSRRWELEGVQTLVGLIGCVTPFMVGAGAVEFCNRANQLLAPQPGVPQLVRLLPADFIRQLHQFMPCCVPRHFIQLTRNPRGVHADALFCAADARAAADCASTGWGLVVGKFYAAGSWPANIRAHLRTGRLSISPLEFLAALFAHRKWLGE